MPLDPSTISNTGADHATLPLERAGNAAAVAAMIVTPASVVNAAGAMDAGQKAEMRSGIGIETALPKGLHTVALAGDSIFCPYTTAGTSLSQPAIHNFLEAYSNGRISVVQPGNRSAFVHAVGGTDSGEFVSGQTWAGSTRYQATELIADKAGIDLTLIHLGPNDIQLSGYDLSARMSILESSVATLTDAGMHVGILTCVPGDARATATGTYCDQVAAWNDELIARFAAKELVTVFDLRSVLDDPTRPGYLRRDLYSGDGTHPLPAANSAIAKRLVELLDACISAAAPDPFSHEWVTVDPHSTAPNDADKKITVFAPTGGSATVAFSPRFDTVENANFADVTVGRSVQAIGAATNSKVTYTAATGVRMDVSHYAATGQNNATLRVEVTEIAGIINIVVFPVATGLTITSTAAQVAAAVNALPQLSGRVSAVADGTGAAAVSYGKSPSAEIRRVLDKPDAVTIANGDVVRAIIELIPYPGTDLNISHFSVDLRGGGGYLSAGFSSSFYGAAKIAEPHRKSLVVAGPWTTVTAAQNQLAPRFYIGMDGKFRIGRFGVQRRSF